MFLFDEVFVIFILLILTYVHELGKAIDPSVLFIVILRKLEVYVTAQVAAVEAPKVQWVFWLKVPSISIKGGKNSYKYEPVEVDRPFGWILIWK